MPDYTDDEEGDGETEEDDDGGDEHGNGDRDGNDHHSGTTGSMYSNEDGEDHTTSDEDAQVPMPCMPHPLYLPMVMTYAH